MFSLQQTKPLWKSLPLQNFSDAVLNYSYHYAIVASFILYTISESSNTTLMIVDRKVLLTVDDKTTIAIYCLTTLTHFSHKPELFCKIQSRQADFQVPTRERVLRFHCKYVKTRANFTRDSISVNACC